MAGAINTKWTINQSGVFFRHCLSADQRKTLGNQLSIIRIWSVIRTSHWTFYFSLGKNIRTGKKSWQFIHFAPSLEPDDVWLGRPTLFDVVLFWECPAVKKIFSFQIKEKYFCVQLLNVTFAIFQCVGFVPSCRLCFKPIFFPSPSQQRYPQCVSVSNFYITSTPKRKIQVILHCSELQQQYLHTFLLIFLIKARNHSIAWNEG